MMRPLPPLARLDVTRMLLIFASFMGIKASQMEVKCAFWNGYLQGEAYVE